MILAQDAAASGESGFLQRQRRLIQPDVLVQRRQCLPQACSGCGIVLELIVDARDCWLQDGPVDHRRGGVGGVDANELVAEGPGLRYSLGLGHTGLLERCDEALAHVLHQFRA